MSQDEGRHQIGRAAAQIDQPVAIPLMANLEPAGLWLLVAGGLAYTVGTIFYAAKKVPYFHMIWHLFVLAGSVLHFLAVLLYVMPVR